MTWSRPCAQESAPTTEPTDKSLGVFNSFLCQKGGGGGLVLLTSLLC